MVLLSQVWLGHARVAVFDHLADLISNVGDMGPHTSQKLAENENALVGHLECADAWDHRVGWSCVVFTWDKLAVSILHGPRLWNLVVEHGDIGAS